MLIRELELRNFKSFGGVNRIRFPEPSGRRSLYLIGGLNGAGKTSVMQAFALCLLGRRAAGLPAMFEAGKERRRNYETWLSACLTQGVSRESDHMSLAVTLNIGPRHDLEVRRTWWFDNGSLAEEALQVRDKSNGQIIGGVDAEDFVQNLFPRHLADFVFFDGEDVRSLAADGQATNVVEGLDRLLNLEPIKRLQADIRKLARARRENSNTSAEAHALVRLEDQEQAIGDSLTQLAGKRDALKREVSRVQKQHQRLSNELSAALDGKAPATMSQIDARSKALTARRKELRGRLAKALSDWVFILPLLPSLSEHAAFLEEETTTRVERLRHKIETEAIDGFVDQALAALVGSVLSQGKRAQAETVLQSVRSQILDQGDFGRTGSWAAQHFTDEEVAQAANGVRAFLTRDLESLGVLAQDVATLDREYEHVVRSQQLLAARPALDSVMKQRDELLSEINAIQAEVESIDGQIEAETEARKRVRSASTNLRTTLAASGADVAWLRRADAVLLGIDTYLRAVRVHALDRVDERLLEGLRLLLRKRTLVGSARVNRATFAIEIENAKGYRVDLPSAGEHQLVAMAFTRAMLHNAPISLPFFIDTPLGRLDAEHRNNVVREFLPSVSRQVFILSTDEEVVGPLLQLAKSRTVATYMIVHNEKSSTSEWRENEYFDQI